MRLFLMDFLVFLKITLKMIVVVVLAAINNTISQSKYMKEKLDNYIEKYTT